MLACVFRIVKQQCKSWQELPDEVGSQTTTKQLKLPLPPLSVTAAPPPPSPLPSPGVPDCGRDTGQRRGGVPDSSVPPRGRPPERAWAQLAKVVKPVIGDELTKRGLCTTRSMPWRSIT